jgi:sec-independent protein translocase protein TatB
VYDNKRMGVDMIFIFLLALILFGPKRLPEIAREVGKFMAEFKRASNDFKYQLQAEIDKAGATPPATASQPAAPPSASADPVVLPPAAPPVTDAKAEQERMLKTARMAFEAQNFTLRPPEPPPVPSTALEPPPVSEPQSASAGASAQPHSAAPADAVATPAKPPAAGNSAAMHNS